MAILPAIGRDSAFLAILLFIIFARFAGETGIDKAADADHVALFEGGHIAADGGDTADNFVPGNARIDGAPAPFISRCVNVGMADAAIVYIDGDIFRARIAPVNGERRQRRVFAVSGVSGDFTHRTSISVA